MSVDLELEEEMARAKAKWDALTPAQQAKYLRKKVAELNRQIEDLDAKAKMPKQ